MALITDFLNKIKTAIYGEEIRNSIHDALAAMNTESETALSNSNKAVSASNEASSKINKVITDTAQTLDSAKSYSQAASQSATAANDSKVSAELAKDAAETASTSAQNSAGVAIQKSQELSGVVNTISSLNTQISQVQDDINTLNQKMNLKVDTKSFNAMNLSIINNTAYPSNYETDINFGKQIGLPVDWVYIKYFRHTNINGHGSQMAIPFEGGEFTSAYIRNAVGSNWGKWNDLRAIGNAEVNSYRITVDANTAIESGKLYYCSYGACQNIPNATKDDGILISYMHRTDILYGYQIFMTWNNNGLWTRNIINNTFTPWGEFLTTRAANANTITNANDATENGKIYYCLHGQTANLPYLDDGIIQVFSMNNGKGNETVCFQMWYSWNNDVVCYRKCIFGTWSLWKRIATV